MSARRLPQSLVAVFLSLLAVTAATGGMAELGRKGTLTEATGTDPAVGGGIVELTANGHVFTRPTAASDTVSALLELLEGDVNASGTGLAATHAPGDSVITVTGAGGAELTQVGIRTTDPGFGYVKAMRVSADRHGSLRAVTEAAKGTDAGGVIASRIRIVVSDTSSHEVEVTLSPGETPASINSRVVTALCAAGVPAALSGGEIVFTSGPPTAISRSVLWEDNDRRDATPPGIVSIGTTSGPPAVEGIPTLSDLGLIALVTLLAAAAVWRLRATA